MFLKNNKLIHRKSIKKNFFGYSAKKFSIILASILILTNTTSLLMNSNVIFAKEKSVRSENNSAIEPLQSLNKIINGDFENNHISEKQNWLYKAGEKSKIISENDNSYGKIESDSNDEYILQSIPTISGKTYKVSADIKVNAPEGESPSKVFLVAMKGSLENTVNNYQQIEFSTKINEWQKNELEFVADTSQALIGIVKKGTNNKTEISIDNVVVTENESSNSKVIWYDEFSGNDLDQTTWRYELGSLRGNEQQHYVSSKENVFLRDDNLVLKITDRPKEYQYDNPRWIGRNPRKIIYNSGDICTMGKKEFLYGRIEMKAKLPKGKGAFPAFWTLGNVYPWPSNGELDILEMIGAPTDERLKSGEKPATKTGDQQSNKILYGTPHFYYANTNDPDKDGSYAPYVLGGNISLANDLNDDYHIFGINWTPERVEWYIDGVIYNTMYLFGDQRLEAAAKCINSPQHLKINLAAGGNWAGDAGTHLGEDNTEFVIDWVRWAQTDEQEQAMNEYYKTQPVISGIRDFTITEGSDDNLLDGITVDKDNYYIDCTIDNEYMFDNLSDVQKIESISMNEVNTLSPGVYNINYKAQPKGIVLEETPTHKVTYKSSTLIVLPKEELVGVKGDSLSSVELPNGWEWQNKDLIIGSQETYPVIFRNLEGTGNERTTIINIPLSVVDKEIDNNADNETDEEPIDKNIDNNEAKNEQQNIDTNSNITEVNVDKDNNTLPKTGGQNSNLLFAAAIFLIVSSLVFLMPKKKIFKI